MEVLPSPKVGGTNAVAKSDSPKPSRFSRKQRGDSQLADTTQRPPSSGVSSNMPERPTAIGMSGGGWFFASSDADDVEWEGRVLAFVDNVVSTLPHTLTKRGALSLGHGSDVLLKELTILRQALTLFGCPSSCVNMQVVKMLEKFPWFDSSQQQVMRAITAVANAPQPDAEHSVSRMLHRICALVLEGRVNSPTHEVIEFLHAVVCQGGLRRVHGLHMGIIGTMVTHVHEKVNVKASGEQRRLRLDPEYQIMLLEGLIHYVSGWDTTAATTDDSIIGRLMDSVLGMLKAHHPLFSWGEPMTQETQCRSLSRKELLVLSSLSVTLVNQLAAINNSPHSANHNTNPIAATALLRCFGKPANLQIIIDRINRLTSRCIANCDVGYVSQLLCSTLARRATSSDLAHHRSGMIRWYTEHVLCNPIVVTRCCKASQDGRFGASLLAIAAAGDDQLRRANESSDHHPTLGDFGGVSAELWSSAQASIRSFSQIVTLVRVCEVFVPDGVCCPGLASLVSRKGEQLMLRTGTFDSIVSLLSLVGPSEEICQALVKLLERDLSSLGDKTSRDTYISLTTLLTALENIHPSVKSKALSPLIPIACVTLAHAQLLDDVFRLLLLFAPVVMPDDLVTLARYVPFHLAENPSGAPQPATFLSLLQFFRVGKQPRTVRHLRGLFGSFLAKHQMGNNFRVEDVLRLVDVPDGLRTGSYWRISHRTLFKRVRTELNLDRVTTSQRVTFDEGSHALKEAATTSVEGSAEIDQMAVVLSPLRVEHWILALKFDQMYSNNMFSPQQPATMNADRVEKENSVFGTELLSLMLCHSALQRYVIDELMTKKFSVAECTKFLDEVIEHWETVARRPQGMIAELATNRQLTDKERETFLRWSRAWADPIDADHASPVVEHEMFRLLTEPYLKRIFSPSTVFEGCAFAAVLVWGPAEWNDTRMLEHVYRRAQSLREGGGTPRVVCVGVDKLVSWCRCHVTSLEKESTWRKLNGVRPSDDLRNDVAMATSIVGNALWLQWRALDDERHAGVGTTSAQSLCDLTASSACALWLDLFWWRSAQHDTEQQAHHSCEWSLGLQTVLIDTLFSLLQSADGSVLAHVVTVLIPNEHSAEMVSPDPSASSSERLNFNLAAQRILGRISMLLGTDLDNFSLEDVMVVTPRLARGGFLTHSTMMSLQQSCRIAMEDGEASDDAATTPVMWRPAKRRSATSHVSLAAVSSMLSATAHLAKAASFGEDDV
jgi:hypothetical protein